MYPLLTPYLGNYRWEGLPVKEYKTDGTGFKDITRQVLFDDPDLTCQLRYFEVQPGGYSSLERHEHVHAVLILRGRGRCLVGTRVIEIDTFDLVSVPAFQWHQFQPAGDEPLGFLCLVNCDRDRPQLPTEADLEQLRQIEEVAEFIKV